jgi:hypothetical protein
MVPGMTGRSIRGAHAFLTILALGLLIATPAMLHDAFGWSCRPRIGPSEGVLVARIGMPIEEMRQRSSLALAKSVGSVLTGSTTVAGSGVFDFEVADTGTRFPRCRYYFIVTGNHGDPRIESMSIGISTEKVSRAELIAANQRVQEQLGRDGWRTGRFVYATEELQHLHGGATESPRGFYWVKGDTLLRLESKHMDEEQAGEDPETAGEWIQFVELAAPSSQPDLHFD